MGIGWDILSVERYPSLDLVRAGERILCAHQRVFSRTESSSHTGLDLTENSRLLGLGMYTHNETHDNYGVEN
jgi:hypothetical protein